MTKLSVLDKAGKQSESIELPDEIFKARVKKDILHQATVMYQANQRQGNASTKERADVRGGGAKPFRQKGTGRARAGSTRSPLWVGGGVTFGPHPKDFSYDLPRKIKQAALRESLVAKYQDNQLICMTDLKEPFTKTKEFAQILKALKVTGKTLALLDGSDSSVVKVSRNIASVNLKRSGDANAYDVLRNRTVLVSKSAIANLLKRIKK